MEGARARRPRLSYGDLERLAQDYRQVLQDYSFARARYPDTGAARRLTRLALAGNAWLQRRDGETRFSLLGFLFERFPAAVRAHRWPIALCTALFATAGLLGLGAAIYEPGMAVAVLGPESVAGLERGRLWTESLTTTIPPAYSSSAIATNNMSVALTSWAGGALGGLGALWVVLFNGYFLGAVVGVTARYSMAGALLEFIAAHGPLEITLILVTAGAGLGMGRAVLVSDDRPRAEAVQEAAREALVVLLGCLPWFALLGVVEGLVSPSGVLAWPTKLLIGLSIEGVFLLLVVSGRRRRGGRGRQPIESVAAPGDDLGEAA